MLQTYMLHGREGGGMIARRSPAGDVWVGEGNVTRDVNGDAVCDGGFCSLAASAVAALGDALPAARGHLGGCWLLEHPAACTTIRHALVHRRLLRVPLLPSGLPSIIAAFHQS